MSAGHDLYGHDERRELLDLLPAGPFRLLDVGCGHGAFGATLSAHRPDIDTTALEPDTAAATAAAEHYTRVITGLFPQDLPTGQFDVVSFNDVLEHFVDPWTALTQTRDLLTPGGHVLASIPNIRYIPVLWQLLAHGDWTYTETGTLDRTHLRFFTRSSIRRMFEDAGYRVVAFDAIHPTRARRWRWLQVMPPNVRDLLFLQFAVLATPAEI